MPRPCPYLGSAEDRSQVFPEADPRHRCHLDRLPQPIGSTFQEKVCLTSTFQGCPRLVAQSPRAAKQEIAPRAQLGELAAVTLSRRAQMARRALHAVSAVPRTHKAARFQKLRNLQPLTLTEILVLALSIAFLVSGGFMGYAVFYRWRVGPGMLVPVVIAEAETAVSTELVPTLTRIVAPTSSATATQPPQVGPATGAPIPASTAAQRVAAIPPTLMPTPMPTPTPTVDPRPAASSPPTRLIIPTIGVDIPVVPVGTKKIRDGRVSKLVWDDVPDAGAFHNTSAYPGHVGNTVINGHRDIQGSVFRRLDRVEIGDEILLYVGDLAYWYAVTETLVVPEAFATAEQRAQNLRLIGKTPEERLTLVTCTPIGLATHRLLVIAIPMTQTEPQMPEAGSELAH